MARKVKKKPGAEYLDPTPLEIPIGVSIPKPLHERVAAMVSNEMSALMESHGYETLQESDDFEVDEEEPDFLSRHELLEAHEAPLDNFFEEEQHRREQARKANENEIEAIKTRLAQLESNPDSPPGDQPME